MGNFIIPTTYEEARRMGVYWDWSNTLHQIIQDRARNIAIKLLKRGVSVENVYEMVGLSEEEQKLKRADYWERICAAIDDKNTEITACIRVIINERICEIAKKLVVKRKNISLTIDDIATITALPQEQIEQLKSNYEL